MQRSPEEGEKGKHESKDEALNLRNTRITLALFVVLVIAIKSTVGSLLLISSQLVYEERGTGSWLFWAVTSMPSICATVVGLLANSFDEHYDLQLGIARTVHFRIVGASLLIVVCMVTLALLPQGLVQVSLAFVVCFLAEAVMLACVQFVAVLDATFTAWVSLAGMLSYLVPIATVHAFALDTSVQWTLEDRLHLILPVVLLNLIITGVFHIAWPDGAQVTALRGLTERLQEGLSQLSLREAPPGAWANLTKFAPYPFYFATVFGALLCLTGGLVLPLIGVIRGSGPQATLIMARFLGEISGQVVATGVAVSGLTNATRLDLGFQGFLTFVRLALTAYMIPVMSLQRQLPWVLMLVFRFIDTYVFSCVQVMVVQACPSTNDRRKVVRNDLTWRNGAGFVGLLACTAIVAAV